MTRKWRTLYQELCNFYLKPDIVRSIIHSKKNEVSREYTECINNLG